MVRTRLVNRIAQYLCRQSYPRLQMSFMAAATGLSGFLASFVMLQLGLETMWLRYPLAVGVSYGVFLLLLKLWIVYQTRSLSSDLVDVADPDLLELASLRGSSKAVSSLECTDSSSGWSDLVSGVDGDAWVALIAVAVAIVAAAVASILVVFSAPALLAEVLLDTMVIAGLRRKLLRDQEQHWTWGVLRKTALSFVIVAAVFALTGGVVQGVRPNAKSIGGIFHAERAEF